MNLRSFLTSLPAALFSAKAIATSQPKPDLVPPIKEWPWHDGTSPVRLWCQAFDYDKKVWGEPHLILAEFDDQSDTWNGEWINNCRRNKFWGRSLNSKERVLLCFDRWDTGLRFFKDAPNIDWSTVYPV